MATLVTDPALADKLIEERRVSGADRWDEVWESTYIMTPLPNNEHQVLVTRLSGIFFQLVDIAGKGIAYSGVNVSDEAFDWTKNYRCPDVAVYLSSNPAEDRGAYRLGGPDFLVEIVSPEDRSREKLDFYAAVGSREVLMVDRDPWSLELYRLVDGELNSVGKSAVGDAKGLASEILPLTLRMVDGEKRPQIEVLQTDGDGKWLV